MCSNSNFDLFSQTFQVQVPLEHVCKTLFTNDCHKSNFIYRIRSNWSIDHLDVVIGLLQRLQENPQNISYTETLTILKKSPKGPQKTTEELFQSRNEVENVRNVPENMDEDDHDENQEIFAFDENMHENGHDENQENEANQNVLNAIVQEEFLKQETDDDDNYEMNNAMIVEDIVDKLIPRNSNSFDLLNKQ